ncbi:MAG: hypothetical protein IH898_15245 [Planctomycetes bacterium]|nr:hypothetical protein [Planctomycetota bacterium]
MLEGERKVMPSFSQRMGLTSASKEIQTKSMDDALRNQLWNALTIAVWNPWKEAYHQTGRNARSFSKACGICTITNHLITFQYCLTAVIVLYPLSASVFLPRNGTRFTIS